MQGQRVVELIVTCQVLPDAVDDQMEKFMFLMEEQGHGQVSNLLFRVLGGGNEIDGFQMTEVDVPAEDVDVEQLADIFLLVIATEVPVLELLADVGQLLVDPLLLEFPSSCIPKICYELNQSSHGRGVPRVPPAEKAGCRRTRQLEGCASVERMLGMRGGFLGLKRQRLDFVSVAGYLSHGSAIRRDGEGMAISRD